jgi:hypothetical protein
MIEMKYTMPTLFQTSANKITLETIAPILELQPRQRPFVFEQTYVKYFHIGTYLV